MGDLISFAKTGKNMSQSKPTFQNCTISQLLAIFEENKAIPQLKNEVETLKMIIEDKKDVMREMEKEIKALKEENKALEDECIEVYDDLREAMKEKKALKEQNENLTKVIHCGGAFTLSQKQIAALKEELREAKKENKLHNLALEVCNAMDLESEEEIQEAYTEFCTYRSERIHKDPIQEQLQQMKAQSEVFKAKYSSLIENHIVEETVVEVTPQEAWDAFKAAKDGLWKECFKACNENNVYPQTIQYSEWNVRDDEGDIVCEGTKKPTKADIQEHFQNGLWIRLYAFNHRSECTILTHFDGKDWTCEEIYC